MGIADDEAIQNSTRQLTGTDRRQQVFLDNMGAAPHVYETGTERQLPEQPPIKQGVGGLRQGQQVDQDPCSAKEFGEFAIAGKAPDARNATAPS